MVVGTTGLCAARNQLLPSFGSTMPVPLWQLVPPMLAITASLATVNGLPVARGSLQVAAARAGWLVAVAGFAAGCARVVDVRTGLTTIVPGTCLLVALTFAAASVLGRASVSVGAAAAVVIVSRTSELAHVENPWLPTSDPIWFAGTALAVLGSVVFVVRGPVTRA